MSSRLRRRPRLVCTLLLAELAFAAAFSDLALAGDDTRAAPSASSASLAQSTAILSLPSNAEADAEAERDAQPAPLVGPKPHFSRYFFKVNDESCSHSPLSGAMLIYGSFSMINKLKPISIKSGERIYIKAQSLIVNGYTAHNCVNVSSFVPDSGHEYEISQTIRNIDGVHNCAIVLTDKSTGQAPGTYIAHPITERCKPLGRPEVPGR